MNRKLVEEKFSSSVLYSVAEVETVWNTLNQKEKKKRVVGLNGPWESLKKEHTPWFSDSSHTDLRSNAEFLQIDCNSLSLVFCIKAVKTLKILKLKKTIFCNILFRRCFSSASFECFSLSSYPVIIQGH